MLKLFKKSVRISYIELFGKNNEYRRCFQNKTRMFILFLSINNKIVNLTYDEFI